MKYKVTVDEDLCLGCGACASQYDDIFDMDEETGKAKPRKAFFSKVDENVVDVCPAGAIEVKEEK